MSEPENPDDEADDGDQWGPEERCRRCGRTIRLRRSIRFRRSINDPAYDSYVHTGPLATDVEWHVAYPSEVGLGE